VCETFKTLGSRPGNVRFQADCRFENRIGAARSGKPTAAGRTSAPVGITVDHQPREDNTAHRDRLRRLCVVFGRDYEDGGTDVRGDSV
jgi:hypothetical protein